MILSMLSNSRGAVLRAVLVVVALVAWLGVGSVGGMAQGKLSTVQTNDAEAFLPSSAESTRADALGRAFVDTKTLPALLVVTTVQGGPVTAEQTAAVRTLAAGLARLALPGAGPGDPTAIGDLLAGDPIVTPSSDGQALLVIIPVASTSAATLLADGTSSTVALVSAVRAAAASTLASDGLQSWVTGPAGFVADLVNAFGGIDGILLLVALLAVLLILVLVYWSPLLPFVVILTAVFGLSLAGLVVYQLALHGVLVLNGQAQGILSILVVGAAVDYSLLVVARYREELHRVDSPYDAMRRAVRFSIAPISASAATVAVGLLCLLFSDLASNRSLGPVAAIGIASAYLAAMTFLPALLLVGGRRARFFFWPRIPRPGTATTRPETDGAAAVGVWPRVASVVGRRARPVWVVTALALALGAAFLPTFRASGTSQTDVFLTSVDAVAGEKVLARHFEAGLVQPSFVVAPATDRAAVLAAVDKTPGVASATVVSAATAGPPGTAPSDAAPTVVDGNIRIDVVTTAASDTQAAVATVRELRTAVHAVSPDALVGGVAAQSLDSQLSGERDLRVIVPAVLLVILLILMLLLRSVVAAVLLMVANVLSFAATLGVAAILFTHVFGFPGADPAVPLYAFCFLVALGVDYSIFLMTRVREEAADVGTRAGVLRGLAVTGAVITSAGVVLAATFAALGVIPLLFLAELAFIVAFGVLLDTFVVRSLLVPALVHDIGRRAWWPGSLARAAE
jgi:putative drug exporter of the RND superfamily